MELFKKYIVLELITFFIIMTVAIGCDPEEEAEVCLLCENCLLDYNNKTYCQSDFTSIDDFNEAIRDLELDNCSCN